MDVEERCEDCEKLKGQILVMDDRVIEARDRVAFLERMLEKALERPVAPAFAVPEFTGEPATVPGRDWAPEFDKSEPSEAELEAEEGAVFAPALDKRMGELWGDTLSPEELHARSKQYYDDHPEERPEWL